MKEDGDGGGNDTQYKHKEENDEEKPSNSVAVQNRKCFLLSCERIQSVTSTLLRIEWNEMEWKWMVRKVYACNKVNYKHFIVILLSPGKSGSVAHVSKLFRRIFPVVHRNASVIGMYLHLDYCSRQKLLLAFIVHMTHSMRSLRSPTFLCIFIDCCN